MNEHEIQPTDIGDSHVEIISGLMAEVQRLKEHIHSEGNRIQVLVNRIETERAELEDELMRVRAELDEARRALDLLCRKGTRVVPVRDLEVRGGLWGVSNG